MGEGLIFQCADRVAGRIIFSSTILFIPRVYFLYFVFLWKRKNLFSLVMKLKFINEKPG